MDLDRCPKCGARWTGGDFCSSCKFIPIGAGLQNLPKKKKKKVRRYVEPGSSRGLLTFIFLAMTGYASYKYQPWKDDWELVRALFGKGRHFSIVGEWVVTKTVQTSKKPGILANDKSDKGIFKFGEKGNFALDIVHPDSETKASGSYEVAGTIVALNQLHSSGDEVVQIPSAMNMNLSWQGKNHVLASNKTEAIYLERRKSGSSLKRFMQMGLSSKEKPDEGAAPSDVRGSLGNIKRSYNESIDEANGN